MVSRVLSSCFLTLVNRCLEYLVICKSFFFKMKFAFLSSLISLACKIFTFLLGENILFKHFRMFFLWCLGGDKYFLDFLWEWLLLLSGLIIVMKLLPEMVVLCVWFITPGSSLNFSSNSPEHIIFL